MLFLVDFGQNFADSFALCRLENAVHGIYFVGNGKVQRRRPDVFLLGVLNKSGANKLDDGLTGQSSLAVQNTGVHDSITIGLPTQKCKTSSDEFYETKLAAFFLPARCRLSSEASISKHFCFF